ncbi:MAG TPA: hypothetical protein VFQ63_03235 [Patescibacteria group bacterium]|nr:hypothetical protein [Patescibacteria group bacterium]
MANRPPEQLYVRYVPPREDGPQISPQFVERTRGPHIHDIKLRRGELGRVTDAVEALSAQLPEAARAKARFEVLRVQRTPDGQLQRTGEIKGWKPQVKRELSEREQLRALATKKKRAKDTSEAKGILSGLVAGETQAVRNQEATEHAQMVALGAAADTTYAIPWATVLRGGKPEKKIASEFSVGATEHGIDKSLKDAFFRYRETILNPEDHADVFEKASDLFTGTEIGRAVAKIPGLDWIPTGIILLNKYISSDTPESQRAQLINAALIDAPAVTGAVAEALSLGLATPVVIGLEAFSAFYALFLDQATMESTNDRLDDIKARAKVFLAHGLLSADANPTNNPVLEDLRYNIACAFIEGYEAGPGLFERVSNVGAGFLGDNSTTGESQQQIHAESAMRRPVSMDARVAAIEILADTKIAVANSEAASQKDAGKQRELQAKAAKWQRAKNEAALLRETYQRALQLRAQHNPTRMLLEPR